MYVVAISRAISAAQTQPTPMDIGGVGKGTASTIKHSKHVQDAETRITLQPTVPTRRAENVERSVIWQVRVDLLEPRSPRQRVAVRRAREASAAKTCENCGVCGHLSSQCPKKKVHAGRVDHRKSSGQSGNHHGWRDWKLLCQRE